MSYSLTQPVNFDEFIAWYPERCETQYELHNGVIVEMPPPTGDHEEVAAALAAQLILEIYRLGLPCMIPKTCIVKSSLQQSGYAPDIIVLNQPSLLNEPLWKKASTVSLVESVRLIVEVVSTNWRDDYLIKFSEYEAMGIPEYWIVDYLALGAKRYTGSPKQPTLSLHALVDGEYQITQFRRNERIQSPTFPELKLTAQQVLRT